MLLSCDLLIYLSCDAGASALPSCTGVTDETSMCPDDSGLFPPLAFLFSCGLAFPVFLRSHFLLPPITATFWSSRCATNDRKCYFANDFIAFTERSGSAFHCWSWMAEARKLCQELIASSLQEEMFTRSGVSALFTLFALSWLAAPCPEGRQRFSSTQFDKD